jgi:2-polyprenyl-3-methyl-5-hydroxy-6-metoxy-1,4-benzoquinol methylase
VTRDPADLDGATGYGADFPYHDENLLMLDWYASRLERTLRERRARRLLSLGIGHQVVSRRLASLLGSALDAYTIVEGSQARIDELAGSGELAGGVEVVRGYFEEYRPQQAVDAVEMGFVLEHVADPALLLARYQGFLAPGGLLAIAVPNARSLHRLVGERAGLLDDLYRLSEHDLAVGHRRYFDRDRLVALVRGAGLRVLACEGILLKPFTTGQLERLGLDARVTRALLSVGADYPDIANALYLEACL